MIAFEYLPILILMGTGVLFAGIFTFVAVVLGPKRRSTLKDMPFESGFASTGLVGQRYDVKFYMTALVFLIFDVEIVFLYPWAVKFREMGWFGFIEGLIFVGLLSIGLIYVWKKGALEWE